MDPDTYEPVMVRMEPTKDNWRLVGLSKLSSKDLSGGMESGIIEDRIPIDAHRLDRGHYQIIPQSALEPGEYAMVLRPLQAGKKKKGVATRDQQAETQIFFSVWDFSIK